MLALAEFTTFPLTTSLRPSRLYSFHGGPVCGWISNTTHESTNINLELQPPERNKKVQDHPLRIDLSRPYHASIRYSAMSSAIAHSCRTLGIDACMAYGIETDRPYPVMSSFRAGFPGCGLPELLWRTRLSAFLVKGVYVYRLVLDSGNAIQ